MHSSLYDWIKTPNKYNVRTMYPLVTEKSISKNPVKTVIEKR